jgi:hypothetical protein
VSDEPTRLHSERAGRARTLSTFEFSTLLWKRIVRAREYHWLFKGSLEPYRGLGPELEPARIEDAEDYFLRRLRFGGLGQAVLRDEQPSALLAIGLNLDLLLDLIELLHAEVVANPVFLDVQEGGGPIEEFDIEAGREIFRAEMNEILPLLEPPLELLPSGKIARRDAAHGDLHREPLPAGVKVPAEIADPVTHAVGLYLSRGASIEDRRAAVRQLADALEHLRPSIRQELLRGDERDLFLIANKFAIRHNDPAQRRAYDSEIWLEWLFHVYLSTIRTIVALRDRQDVAAD